MSYVQLSRNLKDTKFTQLLSVCEDMLLRLEFKFNIISCAWLSGSIAVIFNHDDNEFRVQGNHCSLVFTKGGDILKFFFDFLSAISTKVIFNTDFLTTVNDHFVPRFAGRTQILESIETRLGHSNFDSVYYKTLKGAFVACWKTDASVLPEY
jgi:hypothetical protein